MVVGTYPKGMIISIYLAFSQCNARIVLACSYAARLVLVELASLACKTGGMVRKSVVQSARVSSRLRCPAAISPSNDRN